MQSAWGAMADGQSKLRSETDIVQVWDPRRQESVPHRWSAQDGRYFPVGGAMGKGRGATGKGLGAERWPRSSWNEGRSEGHSDRSQDFRHDRSGADFPPEAHRGGARKRALDEEPADESTAASSSAWKGYSQQSVVGRTHGAKFCTHCRKTGHVVEFCWDLNRGSPPKGWGSTPKGYGKVARREVEYSNRSWDRTSWSSGWQQTVTAIGACPSTEVKDERSKNDEAYVVEYDEKCAASEGEKSGPAGTGTQKNDKRQARNYSRFQKKIAQQLEDYRSGAAHFAYRPSEDPDERLVRRTAVALMGTDGDEEVHELAMKVVSLQKSVSGVVTNDCVFQSVMQVDMHQNVYTDIDGVARIRVGVNVNAFTEIDMPKEEFDRDISAAISKLKEKFTQTVGFVVNKLGSSLMGYFQGKSVERLQFAFNSADTSEKIAAMAVPAEERREQLEEMNALNEKLLRDRAGGDEEVKSQAEEELSTKDGTELGGRTKSEASDRESEAEEIGGDEPAAEEFAPVDPSMVVDLSSSVPSSATGSASIPEAVNNDPNPREAAPMAKNKKRPTSPRTVKVVGFGPLHEKVDLSTNTKGTLICAMGKLEFVFDNQDSNQRVLGPWIYGPVVETGLVGFKELAPVTNKWVWVKAESKKGDPIDKPAPGPSSAMVASAKTRKAGSQERPYSRAITISKTLFVDPDHPRTTAYDFIPYGDQKQFESLKECMTAEELEQLKPRRYVRLLNLHRGGAAPPALTPAMMMTMARECLILEMVYYAREKPTVREFSWYVRCTCCRVAFELWSSCELGRELEHVRETEWRKIAIDNEAVVDHFSSSEHVILYSEYGERLTALLGPGEPGKAMRHMKQSPVLAGSLYRYHGHLLDSPSPEAAPLPTKESIHETMGRPEGLIPAVWQAAQLGKIRLHLAAQTGQGRHDEFIAVKVDDIAALHAGVVYWGMNQMGNQYAKTRRLMPCIYADMRRLPDTNDEYFDKFLGVRPCRENPHPELALLARAMDKMDALNKASSCGKRDSAWDAAAPTSEELAVYKLPPATKWQGWYPVVRIELKESSEVRAVDVNICPVCCMVQIVQPDAGWMTAWNLSIAKYTISDEAVRAVEKFAGMRAQMDVVRME